MVKSKSGKILNIASTAAFQPGPLMAVYYATKAYVLFLGEALSKELEDTGVSVTTYCPGATESGFQKASQAGSSKLFKSILVSSESVAKSAIKAMNSKKTLGIHGFVNWVGVQSVRFLPRKVMVSIVANVQSKI